MLRKCSAPTMCHVSYVMCHVTLNIFNIYLFLTMWWSYLLEGLLSTGPTPSILHSNSGLKISFTYHFIYSESAVH